MAKLQQKKKKFNCLIYQRIAPFPEGCYFSLFSCREIVRKLSGHILTEYLEIGYNYNIFIGSRALSDDSDIV